MRELLKNCSRASLIFLLFIIFGQFNKVKGDWEFDANPPAITFTLTCSVSGDTIGECSGNSVDVRVHYTEPAGDSGLLSTSFTVTNSSATGSGSYPAGTMTADLPSGGPVTIPVSPPIYGFTVNATAGDNAGNSSTANTSFSFITPWYKLKNASFHKLGSLSIAIPSTIIQFDSDDDGAQRYLDYGTTGVVSAEGGITTSPISPQNWKKANYARMMAAMPPATFLAYAKTRKEYETTTNITTDPLVADKINIYSGNLTINDSNKNDVLNPTKTILIVEGDVTLNVNNKFNPSKKPVAILVTGALNINSQVQEMNGVYVANSVDFASDIAAGSTTNNELKIQGNIVSFTDSTSSLQKRDRVGGSGNNSRRKPAVFIIFDPEPLIKMINLLSVYIYDWRQLR